MTRIALCFDIHYQHNPNKIERLAEKVADYSPDLVILGGDLADCKDGFRTVLRQFRMKFDSVAAIAGNHDLWGIYWSHYQHDHMRGWNPVNGSFHVWDEFIPEICEEFDVTYLEKNNYQVGNWGIAGSIAWYDYSFKDREFEIYPDEHFFVQKKNYNNDGNFLKFSLDDKEFSKIVQEGFSKNLEKLDADSSVENILVVTHVPIYKEAVGDQSDKSAQWRFGSSYFYNLTFGRNLKSEKLRGVVSGHTHVGRNQKLVAANGKEIHYINSDAEYFRRSFIVLDLNSDGSMQEQIIHV